MMLVVEQGFNQPVNLGSGTGVTIREIAETVARLVPGGLELVWDTSKPSGDRKRLMDTTRAAGLGFQPRIPLEDGIRETMEWYAANRDAAGNRYNAFTDTTYVKPAGRA
jgi:GDP-L-fucose synthase